MSSSSWTAPCWLSGQTTIRDCWNNNNNSFAFYCNLWCATESVADPIKRLKQCQMQWLECYESHFGIRIAHRDRLRRLSPRRVFSRFFLFLAPNKHIIMHRNGGSSSHQSAHHPWFEWGGRTDLTTHQLNQTMVISFFTPFKLRGEKTVKSEIIRKQTIVKCISLSVIIVQKQLSNDKSIRMYSLVLHIY